MDWKSPSLLPPKLLTLCYRPPLPDFWTSWFKVKVQVIPVSSLLFSGFCWHRKYCHYLL
jgi:hypothetical protein